MADVLTLEILDKAIEQVKRYEADHKIIGYRLNPLDFQDIKARTKVLLSVGDGEITMTPPYRGLILISDKDVPPGYPYPVKKR